MKSILVLSNKIYLILQWNADIEYLADIVFLLILLYSNLLSYVTKEIVICIFQV